MQSHHSSFLSWLMEIWSAFSNQDKPTFPLVYTSRASIVDVSYTAFPTLHVLGVLPVNKMPRTNLIVFRIVSIKIFS